LAAGVARSFDVDSTNLAEQGGSATGCGIPLAVAQAVTMTIVAVQPAGRGYFTVWGLGPQPPASSVLNYASGEVIANTAIIPIVPGGGNDFTLFSLAATHLVVDVLGYFAASNATRLDCMTLPSEVVAVPIDDLTVVDAFCPAGRAATGGGYDTAESTIAFPGLFMTSTPLANGWRTAARALRATSRRSQGAAASPDDRRPRLAFDSGQGRVDASNAPVNASLTPGEYLHNVSQG
jgi:hypothetical protein